MLLIAIPWDSILISELKWISKHSDEIVVDGDERAIIVKNPDDDLLEELEARGLEYRIV